MLRKLFNTLNLRKKRKKSSKICFQTHCSNHLLSQIIKVSNIVIVCKFLSGNPNFGLHLLFILVPILVSFFRFFFQFKQLTVAYFGKMYWMQHASTSFSSVVQFFVWSCHCFYKSNKETKVQTNKSNIHLQK